MQRHRHTVQKGFSTSTKFLMVFVITIGGVIAVWKISAIFAGTIVNRVVTTIPSLNEGELLHWSFDATDINLGLPTAEVRDSSGNAKHGDAAYDVASTKITFSAVGTSTYAVPTAITQVTIKTWGAGGGSGGTGNFSGSDGGAGGGGGFAQITDYPVTPGSTLTINVGGGGQGGQKTASCVQGGGGGGGGFSAVHDGSHNYYLMAPGGGGGGAGSDTSAEDGGPGGPGGGNTGTDGTTGIGGGGDGAGGATQTAGGSAGAGVSAGGDGIAGQSRGGGRGGQNGTTCAGGTGGTNAGGAGGGAAATRSGGGGGGGGGYFGGGGGEAGVNSTNEEAGGGGGGGSATTTPGSDGTRTAGSGTSAGNNTDTDYASGKGAGASTNTTVSSSGTAGGDGLVVLSFATTSTGTTTAGRIGQGILLDGAGSYVNGGDVDGGTLVKSISFWMRAATTTVNQGLMNIDYSDGRSIEANSANTVVATAFPAATIYVNNSTASLVLEATSTWYHIVVTDTTGVSADNFSVGSTTKHFGGVIDDVRLYSRVLSGKEISQLYELGGTTKINKSLRTIDNLRNGLQGYWSFDGKSIDLSQNTAEIIDDSGNGITGDWINHSSTTVVGRVGQGVSFSGSNYVDFTNSTDLLRNVSAGTLAAWVKPTIVAGSERIAVDVTVGTSNSTRLSFSVTGTGGVSVVARAGDAEAGNVIDTVASPITNEGWHHVVAIADYANDTITVYVDGVSYPMASTPTFTASATSDTSPNNFAIGADASLGGTGRYVGSIDDVRIYNRALSPKEAVDLYKLGATSKIGISNQHENSLNQGLDFWYPFDGKYITLAESAVTAEILDATGNGYTGDWVKHSSTTKVGRIGQALEFDGTDDYILSNYSTNPSTGDFTFAVWLYVNNLQASVSSVLAQLDGGGTGRNWLRVSTTGVLETQLNAGAVEPIPSGYTVPLKQWIHVAIVHYNTANEIEWFVDGVSNGTATANPSSNSAAVVLGASKIFATPYSGAIDDFRFYSRALSAKEIKDLYQYGK